MSYFIFCRWWFDGWDCVIFGFWGMIWIVFVVFWVIGFLFWNVNYCRKFIVLIWFVRFCRECRWSCSFFVCWRGFMFEYMFVKCIYYLFFFFIWRYWNIVFWINVCSMFKSWNSYIIGFYGLNICFVRGKIFIFFFWS